MSLSNGQPESSMTTGLSAAKLRSELAQISVTSIQYGAHTVDFQPRTKYPTEDRHLIEDWHLPNGIWKFIGIFDGHGAGHEAVDFVLETLPGMIKASLASEELKSTKPISPSTVERILVHCISGIDDRIKEDFLTFFPGGPDQIALLSDDEIRSEITDPRSGISFPQILRARTGTTALIALIDSSNRLYVASLGDCEALLAIRNSSTGSWETKVLNKPHNAANKREADRVRSEHPGEEECILQNRTLGLITLTRAIGDSLFKLPSIYTERVLALSTPPIHENYNISALLSRNITPPYLSNIPEVKHIDLSEFSSRPEATPVFIMCSDGLSELYSRHSKEKSLARNIETWLAHLGPPSRDGDNLAFELLWDALGGGDERLELVGKIIRGMPGKRVDDTTAVVLRLQ